MVFLQIRVDCYGCSVYFVGAFKIGIFRTPLNLFAKIQKIKLSSKLYHVLFGLFVTIMPFFAPFCRFFMPWRHLRLLFYAFFAWFIPKKYVFLHHIYSDVQSIHPNYEQD